MGVKNIRWHMVSCVDDRGRGRVGVVDLRRKKVLSLVNPRHISTLQSSSGGILRGWESMLCCMCCVVLCLNKIKTGVEVQLPTNLLYYSTESAC